jgi:hypothetical protein
VPARRPWSAPSRLEGSWRTPAITALPVLSLLALAVGLGLLAVAVADTIARDGSRWAEPLFWAGMLVAWVPPVVRLLGGQARRSERIALLVLLGMALYVVKILYSPRYFSGHDEFLHWRTAEDISRTGKVFNANPVLPVSPLYPGLEIVTSAVTKLTGLSVFVSGTLVVGAARLISIMALYLLFERVSRSSWLASVATAAYFTNPQFLFFDSSFAYESLGLSLALLVLYTVARGGDARGQNILEKTLLVVLPLAAAVVTHHIASFALVISLLLLATVALALSPRSSRLWFSGIALIGTGLVLAWLYLVAGDVIHYLAPSVSGGVSQVIDLIRGEGASRHLFESYVGQRPLPLDRAASYAFTAITLVALPIAWFRIWRARRVDAFTTLFVLGSLAYPLSGLFHFTAIGADLGARLTAFIFVPVAFCMAMALPATAKGSSGFRTAALALVAGVLLYGGVATGNPRWLRLPGPYLVSADSRSIEPEGIAAGSWAKEFLGRGNRIGADRINRLLMMTYGDQWPVTTLADKVDLTPVFFDRLLTPFDRSLLQRGSVRYLVVDYRLTRALPWVGVYYDTGEPGALGHKTPIPRAAFAKFDRARRVPRVFDSGDIVIFDVRGIARRG